MHPLDWLAALGLAVLLPIPIYWLVIHPFAAIWKRGRASAAFGTAVPVAMAVALTSLYFLWPRLFAAAATPLWAKALGFMLIGLALYVFGRVKNELGAARLVGKTEVSGGGELRVVGLYQRVRHPSYAAQMATMLGICLLAATATMWALAVVWLLLLNVAIRFEEREMLARFGEPYLAYRARVPAFLPIRLRPRDR